MLVRLSIALLFVFTFANLCAAADCDPLSFKQLVIASKDKRTNLVYSDAQSHTKNLDGSHDATAIMGFGAFTDGGKLKYAEALNSQFNLNFSENEKRNILISGLDANGRASYIACVENSNKTITLIPPDMTSGESGPFPIQVHLHDLPIDALVPISVTIANGKFINYPRGILTLGQNGTVLSGKFKGGARIPATISRDPSLRLTLTATAETKIPDSDSFSVPGEPKVIMEETRFSDLYKGGCWQCADGQAKRLCVNVPDDEIIEGGSEEYISFEQGGGARGTPPGPIKVKPEDYTASYKPHQSCVTVGFSALDVDHSNWCGVGYLSVTVLIAVPRGQTSSGRPQKPNYQLACKLHP